MTKHTSIFLKLISVFLLVSITNSNLFAVGVNNKKSAKSILPQGPKVVIKDNNTTYTQNGFFVEDSILLARKELKKVKKQLKKNNYQADQFKLTYVCKNKKRFPSSKTKSLSCKSYLIHDLPGVW